jgi:hypothetical protein
MAELLDVWRVLLHDIHHMMRRKICNGSFEL